MFSSQLHIWLPDDAASAYAQNAEGFGFGVTFVAFIIFIAENISAKYRFYAVGLACASRYLGAALWIYFDVMELASKHLMKLSASLFFLSVSILACKLVARFCFEHRDKLSPGATLKPSKDQNSEEKSIKQAPFLIYKQILQVLVYRLGLIATQNCMLHIALSATLSTINESLLDFYPVLFVTTIPITIFVSCFATKTKLKSLMLSSIALAVVSLVAILILLICFVHHKDHNIILVAGGLMAVLQIIAAAGLMPCYDFLLVDHRSTQNQSVAIAAILSVEYLIHFGMYFFAKLNIFSAIWYISAFGGFATVCVISGMTFYFNYKPVDEKR